MDQETETVRRLLESFFKATGIEVLCFGTAAGKPPCYLGAHTYEDFLLLSAGRIERFLADAFSRAPDPEGALYTFFLDHTLACNIVLLYGDGACLGAAVAQPVSLDAPGSGAEAGPCAEADPVLRDRYRRALGRAPVVPYERLLPLGETLSALSRSLFGGGCVRQILQGGDADPTIHSFFRSGTVGAPAAVVRHRGQATYLKLRESISRGDADMLMEALDGLTAGQIPMDRLAARSFVRSMKNRCIEVCALCGFAAIDAGAAYARVRDLSDGFIREVEELENINEIYETIKSALLAFTRLVAVTRLTAYSKPVRLAMAYIEDHYHERITLPVLAGHVNLSASYLSNLLKKETGMNLADNINRVRVEASKKLLLNTGASVSELSAMTGYAYSNHFARVFKRFTGMSPSEFKNLAGSEESEGPEAKELLCLACDQLRHTMEVFPGFMDVGRIVDPAAHTYWLQPTSGGLEQGTCYDFWGRQQACERCISHMTAEGNKAFAKLDCGGNGAFLVLAVPVTLGGKTYVIELLKNIKDNFFNCIGAASGPDAPQFYPADL